MNKVRKLVNFELALSIRELSHASRLRIFFNYPRLVPDMLVMARARRNKRRNHRRKEN